MPTNTSISKRRGKVNNLILGRLAGYRKIKSNQFIGSCPVPGHGKGKGDKNYSLSVTENHDGIGLYCHAGCNLNEIVDALGIQKTDLSYTSKFSNNGSSSSSGKDPHHRDGKQLPAGQGKQPQESEPDKKPEFVAKYDYFNNEYELVYRVAKFVFPDGSKQFKPYHENNNKWKVGLGDQEKILYNLPAVSKAVETGETIYYVEGEQDADTMMSLGYTATTHPFGGASFEDDYIDMLAGAAEVIIIPDNDETGDKMVKNVASHLYDHVDKLRLLEIPGLKHGEDVTDYMEKYKGSRERLDRLIRHRAKRLKPTGEVDKTPEIITMAELEKMEFPEAIWAVPDLIPTGLTIMAGKPKVGKSWLCLHLGNAISCGGHVFGKIPVDRHDVLYLALEDSRRRIKDRFQDLGYKSSNRFFITTDCPPPDTAIKFLRQQLQNNPNLKIVFIDTLVRLKNRDAPKNKPQYDIDYDTVLPLQEMAIEYEVAIIITHHMRKTLSGRETDFLEEISGTFGLTAGVDTVTGLMKNRKGGADLIFKARGRDVEEKSLALDFDTYSGWRILGDAKDFKYTGERRDIIQLLKDAKEPMQLKEISETLGKNKKTVSTMLTKLVNDGAVSKPEYGKYFINNEKREGLY